MPKGKQKRAHIEAMLAGIVFRSGLRSWPTFTAEDIDRI